MMKYNVKKNGIEIKIGKTLLSIEVFSQEIIRVNRSPLKAKKRESLAVVMKPEAAGWYVEKNILQTSKISLVIGTGGSSLFFYDKKGNLLLAEETGSDKLRPVTVSKEKCINAAQGFKRASDEAIYGLGQYEEGLINYKNCEVLMIQANRVIVNPFLASTHGYGILWDNYSETVFKAGENDFSFDSEVSDGIDYYFVYGGSIDGSIRQYRKLTGQAPMFPKWVFGFWQSKERYTDRDELIYIIKECRKRGIPLDAIVQDWRYWGENEVFSGMEWEKYRFPDPKKMMKEIHELHAHLMCSFWPALGPESKPHKELAKKGHMLPGLHWTGSKLYDAFSKEARDIYWKHIKKCLFDNGVDAYWMDGTEPEFVSAEDRYVLAETNKENGRNELGTMARYLNAFSLMTTKGAYENQRKVSGKKRVFILTRSAFAGQQRNGSASWSGDTFAGWETLKNQVTAAINFSTAGVPYWTSDIGAFYPFFKYKNPLEDKAYKELYLRWFQFVAFTPLLRVHGTAAPREVWRFGEKGSAGYETQMKYINLRYRLMPYVYSTAWKVTSEGYSFMRPLAAEFPDDNAVKDIGSQFMFGKAIMACPVLKELYEDTKNKGDYIYYPNLFTPDGKEHGLIYEIYNGVDFKDLRCTRKLDTSSMGWAGNIPLDIKLEYSQRWTGKILSNEAGKYDFTAITDGSVRIWFDGKLVVDEWSNREEKRFNFSVTLKANTKYSIKLEHQQFRMKQAIMRVNWHTPGMKKYEAIKQVDVYVPKAAKWYDFWTGKTVTPGKILKLKPAVEIMPMYVPAGSIIPMGPKMQYVTEKKTDPIELRVYTGADAEFDIYEDEGDNYNYEKGVYSIITVKWNNKTGTLTIGERKGTFPGMLKSRVFKVVLVRPGRGTGLEMGKTDRTVKYTGCEIKITF
jgi:alpha-D-xyloside xylohydrolase